MRIWDTQSIVHVGAGMIGRQNVRISVLYSANLHIVPQREIIKTCLDAVEKDSGGPDAAASINLNLVWPVGI
jgi:hypothetical protein